MAAQIILEIIDGSLKGQDIITILVGRNNDCYLKLPNDDITVSRYHCLLDINPLSSPPQIQIRDYGSYTGTYVNDRSIGQRPTNQTPTENTTNDYPFHLLKTGDQIRLGKTKIRVSIEILSDADDHYDPAQIIISSTSTTPEDFPPKIPGYTITQKLGQGGFGIVYLAHYQNTQQPVALKVLRPHQQADANARKKFLREIEISRYFNHPHIVRVLDAGESEDLLFLALEFCPYGTVHNLLKKHGGRLPIDTALHIIHQTLDGLEYAHNLELQQELPDGTTKQVKGIVHRDLKPSNILCLSEGDKPTIKVADFGLAKIFDLAGLSGYTPDNSNSEKPSVGGTYAFMPRQQVLDFKYSKPEVDIWSAAACLYQMLTGRLPRNFASSQGSSSDLWKIILETPTQPIRQYNVQIPPKLAEVIDLALRDKSNLHFKTVAEFKQAISQAYL
jgi:eukaryotic-like serine/threonine-protein kinase